MFEGEKDMSETKQYVMTYEGVKKLRRRVRIFKNCKKKRNN